MDGIVFIIGSTRSGTSAVRNALCLTRYKGPGEGHIISLIAQLGNHISQYYIDKHAAVAAGTFVSRVDSRVIKNGIIKMFEELYCEISQSQYVVDKTPNIEPINALQFIQDAWPKAKIIFCRRRGIENIMSKERKFPHTAFIDHCREWAAIIDAWDNRRDGVRLDWLEIDHYELSGSPRQTAGRIASLLALPPNEEDLMSQYLATERPEQTGPKGVVTLDETHWPPAKVSTFLEICGDTMDRSGYGLDKYWR